MKAIEKARKFNNFEQILIGIIALLLISVLGLFILFFLKLGGFEVGCELEESRRSCITDVCIKAAVDILTFVNNSVDPCLDFYDFVCGNFNEDEDVALLTKLETITNKKLNALIAEPRRKFLWKPLRMQQKFYAACMNMTAIEEDGYNSLLELVDKLGGWPVLYGRFWDESKFDWITSTVKSRLLGLGFQQFLQITGKRPANKSEPVLLQIGTPLQNFIISNLKEPYLELMTSVSLELGAPEVHAKNEFIRVLEFEEQIQAYVKDQQEVGESEIWTISQLLQVFPSIPWISFLKNLTYVTNLQTKTILHFNAERYLKNLLILLSNTPKRIQANYVIWKIIEEMRNYINPAFQPNWSLMFPNLRNPNRSEFCLEQSKILFPLVAETAYIKQYVSAETRNEIKQIWGSIKNQLINTINKLQWLEKDLKNYVISNLSMITPVICASNKLYETELKFAELDEDNNIINMVTKLYAIKTTTAFGIINKNLEDVLEEEFNKTVFLSGDSFYSKKYKVLALPATFLEGILYNVDAPWYLKFAGIGTKISQKLIQEMFSRTMTQQWSTDARKNLNQCILEDNTDDVMSDSLTHVLGANLAYFAYQKFMGNYSPEIVFPGPIFNNFNKIFWIMSTHQKCDGKSVLETKLDFNGKNVKSIKLHFQCSVTEEEPIECTLF